MAGFSSLGAASMPSCPSTLGAMDGVPPPRGWPPPNWSILCRACSSAVLLAPPHTRGCMSQLLILPLLLPSPSPPPHPRRSAHPPAADHDRDSDGGGGHGDRGGVSRFPEQQEAEGPVAGGGGGVGGGGSMHLRAASAFVLGGRFLGSGGNDNGGGSGSGPLRGDAKDYFGAEVGGPPQILPALGPGSSTGEAVPPHSSPPPPPPPLFQASSYPPSATRAWTGLILGFMRAMGREAAHAGSPIPITCNLS